jgi:DNA-binding NtrC family response regulator
MPLMNGIEMVREIFEMDTHANVILMSGGAHLGDLVPDELRRLCSVLDKPFTPARLLEAVRKCIRYETEHHPLSVAS